MEQQIEWPGARRIIRLVSKEKKEHVSHGGPKVYVKLEVLPGRKIEVTSRLFEPFELTTLSSAQMLLEQKSSCENVAKSLLAEAKARYEGASAREHHEASKRDPDEEAEEASEDSRAVAAG